MLSSPHVRICIVLALLSIPVAVADAIILRRGGGGWISLDLTGLFIGAYLLFLPIHFLVSTIAVNLFPKITMWMIHLPSALVAIVLLAVGTWCYGEIRDRADRTRRAEEGARHKLFANVITLDGWTFFPNRDSATHLSISVTVSESGRFAVGVTGKGEGDYGEWYFRSENEAQRMVARAEHFDYQIPLKRDRFGVPQNIEITLYLFADSTGSAGRDVIKIFKSTPVTEVDSGQYFYGSLPEPTR